VKPTAQSTTGSPLPTVLAVCLVAVLLAGGGIVALRRRRSE
jgi:LPXTG-motif cell wall-anchored protein